MLRGGESRGRSIARLELRIAGSGMKSGHWRF
jgi:hypothetical protein